MPPEAKCPHCGVEVAILKGRCPNCGKTLSSKPQNLTIDNDLLIKESVDFISNNLDILSDKIPNHLFLFWLVTDEETIIDIEDTHQWTVFMYSLLKYKQTQGLPKFEIEINVLMSLFQTWQIILSCEEIRRFTDIKTKPFKLFDYDNYTNMMVEIVKDDSVFSRLSI